MFPYLSILPVLQRTCILWSKTGLEIMYQASYCGESNQISDWHTYNISTFMSQVGTF